MQPQDPMVAFFGQATQLAALLHEQYEAFVRAGFTDKQAMKLLLVSWHTSCTKTLMQGEP